MGKVVATAGAPRRRGRWEAIPLLLCSVLLVSAFSLARPAWPAFRLDILAKQIERLWFVDQDGERVHGILNGLSKTEVLELLRILEEDPSIQELQKGRGAGAEVRRWHSLRREILDVVR